MMNEEEKLDNLLRKKLSERDFFFDEENWQQLNEKIEEQEKKRKQTRFIIVFLGGLALGIALTVPVMNMMKSSTPEKLVSSSNTGGPTTPGAVSKSQPIAASNPGSTGITKNNSVEPIPVENAKPENGNTETVNKPNAGNTTLSAKPVVEAANNQNMAAVQKKHKKTTNTIRVAANNTHSALRNNNTEAFANNTIESSGISYRKVRSKSRKTSATVAINTQEVKMAAESAEASNKNASQLAVNNTADNNAANAGAKNEDEKNVNNNLPQPQNTAVISQNQPANNQVNTTAQMNTAKTDSIKNITASVNPDTNPVPIIKPPARLKAANILSVDAGGGYSLGWKNYGVKEANGISPVLGISVTHFFSKKIALAMGVQYNSLTNLKTPYSGTVTTYDFGINTNSTSVMPTTVHYVAFPVTLRYYFDDNNALCFGGSLLYLVNTSSTVTTTSQNELNPASSQTKSMMGYTQGFSNINLQARVAYRRRIYKAFAISVEGYFGLLDDENTFFADNTFKRNSGLRLILSYDLIK